jgi:hypothetical protein
VTVVVDGATIPIPDKNSEDGLPDGDSIVGRPSAPMKNMYRDKIKQQLGFITGLFVSVRVDLNTKNVETQETTVDPKTSAHLDRERGGAHRGIHRRFGGAESRARRPISATNGALAVGGAGGGSGGAAAATDQTSTTYQNVISSRTQSTRPGTRRRAARIGVGARAAQLFHWNIQGPAQGSRPGCRSAGSMPR